jgi:hypothetical protein
MVDFKPNWTSSDYKIDPRHFESGLKRKTVKRQLEEKKVEVT